MGVDGRKGWGRGARILLVAPMLALWATPGIALADPTLPDPSGPVDAATSAASGAAESAADTASGTVDAATSAADDVVDAAASEADGAASSAASTAQGAASAAGGASPTSAGGGAAPTTASQGAGGSSGSDQSSPAGSGSAGPTTDGGSVNTRAGDRAPAAKVESHLERGESGRPKASGDGRPDRGRGAGARQESQEPDGPADRGGEDDGRVGDLSELVQSGQHIGDSTTVSVVTSPDESDDPPLFEGLPITGFEVSVLVSAAAGLAALGLALLAHARERSGRAS
jgi:hypothetical protein